MRDFSLKSRHDRCQLFHFHDLGQHNRLLVVRISKFVRLSMTNIPLNANRYPHFIINYSI